MKRYGDPHQRVKVQRRDATGGVLHTGSPPTGDQEAGYAGHGGERPPTEATVRTLSVLGHGRNGRDVTVDWWPGLHDVM
jgi:hypothetical protein